MPYRFALEIGRAFGVLAYLLLYRYRRASKEHLRLAYKGLKSEKEISRIARSVFKNLGMGLAEVLSLPKIKKKLGYMVDAEGMDRLDNVLREGRGAIAVTGHFGNWELMAMYFAYKGYPVNVIARPIYYEKYNEWVLFLRRSMGVNVVLRTESPKKILRLLKNNELLGILPDQDIDSLDGIFVDFFGKKAYTVPAPVKLALSSGAPIVPIFIVRKGHRHKVVVEEPIRVEDRGDKEKTILLYTQRWSDILECYIRNYPEQWVWMHNRWKTRPK